MNQLIDKQELKKQEYVTVKQLMDILNISENTIYRYVNKGYFNPIKFKNKNYFKTEEVMGFVKEVFT